MLCGAAVWVCGRWYDDCERAAEGLEYGLPEPCGSGLRVELETHL